MDMETYPKISADYHQYIAFEDADIDTIDGMGDKSITAAFGQDVTIHGGIYGNGTHKLMGFGAVEILNKIDGNGDRWFINCARVFVHDSKDGAGSLYLIDSPCEVKSKYGLGNIYWVGAEPIIDYLDNGEVIHEPSLSKYGEGKAVTSDFTIGYT
jgi:hypothetical protein